MITEANVRACYDVIGFTDSSTPTAGLLEMPGFIDLVPYKTLFLCSSDFGNLGQSIGPTQQSDIIRRVVISSALGNFVHDVHSTSADYIDVSLTQIAQMRWRLTDEKGRAVDAKGHGISVSICVLEKTVV